MGGRLQRLRYALNSQLALIQKLNDTQLKSLPPSSRYLLAPALRLLAAAYAAGSGTRRWLYRHGILSPALLPAPVVSIGNLTHGGTGKTPFVEFLARHYATQHRLSSMILQCGGGTVDETVMLRQLLENLPVHVQDSYSSTAEVKAHLQDHPEVRLVLMDDGLQHLPLVRDLEIVMVNSLSPFGNGHLLPRGTLRELPKLALRRADAVVLHHADLAGSERMEEVYRDLTALAPRHTMFFRTHMQPTSLRSLIPFTSSLDMSAATMGLGQDMPLSKLKGAAVVCLVGIGVPSTVEAHLRALGAAHVEGCGAFDDHHMFTLEDVRAAISRVEELQRSGAFRHVCLLMTEKDYARQHGLFDAVFGQYAKAELAAMSKEEVVVSGPWWDGWGSGGLGWGRSEASLLEEEGLPAMSFIETRSGEGASASSSISSSLRSRRLRRRAGGGSGAARGPAEAHEAAAAARDEAPGSQGQGQAGEQDEAAADEEWGAYVLQSGLAITEHDRRFSSANAVLAAMLRMAVDKFRQRSYLSGQTITFQGAGCAQLPPAAPANLKAVPADSGELEITWNRPSNGACVTTYEEYKVTVTAVSERGRASASVNATPRLPEPQPSLCSPYIPPGAPINLRYTPRDSAVDVCFDAPPMGCADAYTVDVRPKANSRSFGALAPLRVQRGGCLTISQLTNGQAYIVSVTATADAWSWVDPQWSTASLEVVPGRRPATRKLAALA
eukprot:scaffold7.g3699.t1